MTVATLIEKLQMMPRHAIAVVEFYPNDYCEAELVAVDSVESKDGIYFKQPYGQAGGGQKGRLVVIS